MKMKSFFVTALMLTLVSACSDDKLPDGNPDSPTLTGDRAYITIRLNDVNDAATTRADASNPDYSAGAAYERAINNANFYFFSSEGKYMTTGKTVSLGTGTSAEVGNDTAYEWRANVVVALDGLSSTDTNKYPTYLLTTLNYSLFSNSEYELSGKTLADALVAIENLRYNTDSDGKPEADTYFTFPKDGPTQEKDKYFVMTTSSYNRAKTTDGNNNTDVTSNTITSSNPEQPLYFVTKLNADNFVPDGTTTSKPVADNDKIVDVYVERLAAKVTVDTTLIAQKSSNNNVRAVNATYQTSGNGSTITGATIYRMLAPGEEVETGTNTQRDSVYFALEGYTLNGTSKQEYLFKKCDFNTWSGTTNESSNNTGSLGFEWDKAGDHRCLWAVTPYYGSGTYPETYGTATSNTYSGDTSTESSSTATWTLTYRSLQNPTPASNASYCMEHLDNATQMAAHISSATSVLLKGRILKLNNNSYIGTTYFRYARKLYEKQDFLEVVLAHLKANSALNAWVVSSKNSDAQNNTSDFTQIDGKNEYLLSTGKTMQQIDTTYIDVEKPENTKDGYVKVIRKANDTREIYKYLRDSIGENNTLVGKIYAKYETNGTNTPNLQNDVLQEFNKDSYAIGYTDGEMYWNIPIKHLRPNSPMDETVKDWSKVQEGHYGVVRNHWYKIQINKIENIGKGIYNPDEVIVPSTDEQQLYELGAAITILSWKMVTQGVDL